MPSLKIDSFKSCAQILMYCEQLMLDHQFKLMAKDFEGAYGRFEELNNIRIAHLQLMEEEWLGVYQGLLNKIPAGGRPEYFLREKKLILREFKKYIRIISGFALHGPDTSFRLVDLFEGYIWLKDLLDHHDAREKAFLFPVLQQNPDNKEKDRLLKQAGLIYFKLINMENFNE